MPSKKGGDLGIPATHRCKSRGRVLFLILLTVLAQLIVFAGRIKNFNLSAGFDPLHVNASVRGWQSTGGQLKLPGNNFPEKEKALLQVVSTIPPNIVATQHAQESLKVDTPGNNVSSIGPGDGQSQITDGSNLLKQLNRKLTERTKQDEENESLLEKTAVEQSIGVHARMKNNDNSKPKNEQRGSDFLVQLMRDQVATAKAYAKTARIRNNHRLLRDLKLRIQESQHVLRHAVVDANLPKGATEKMESMARTLSKVSQQWNRCNSTEKRLRSMVLSAEEDVRILQSEILFLGQLSARTVPKGLHCLGMRLTVEYYSHPYESEHLSIEKLQDPNLYHFAIFTNNILSASIVVNSVIHHAKEPDRHVFHIGTETLNYAAMKMWFLDNTPGNCTVDVENVDNYNWLSSSLPPQSLDQQKSTISEYSKEHHAKHASFLSLSLKYQDPEWPTTTLLQFFLPKMYPKLGKIVLLDEDIVVQRDLTPLWNVSLRGNIEGTLGSCRGIQISLDEHLNFSDQVYPTRTCGLKIFDLHEWLKQNTAVNHNKLQIQKGERLLHQGKILPGSIHFYNMSHTLGKSWYVLDLGDGSNLNKEELKNAAALHYHGYKPWLETGIHKLNSYWTQFVDYQNPFLQECNISK